MAAIPKNVTLWPNGIIPYVYQQDFPFVDEVEDAIKRWEDAAGVKFITYTGVGPNSLLIQNIGGSSNSSIGMVGGQQTANITNGYKALHE